MSGFSVSHLIQSVQFSCTQVSTAESTAGLTRELHMFSRSSWNMLSALPENRVKQDSNWMKELTLPRHTSLPQSCPKLCCGVALTQPCPRSTIHSYNNITQHSDISQPSTNNKTELVEKSVWDFMAFFYPLYLFSLPETIGSLKQLEQDVQDANEGRRTKAIYSISKTGQITLCNTEE